MHDCLGEMGRGEKGVHSSLLQGSLVEGNDLSLLSGSEECNLCRRAVAGLCPPQAPASLILAALQDESSGWKSRDGLPEQSPVVLCRVTTPVVPVTVALFCCLQTGLTCYSSKSG